MAVIGKIRQNSWILIVLMALALGGFILMDMMGNMDRNKSADVNTLGKVNGEAINRQDFGRYEEVVYGGSQSDPYQRQSTVWNYFVEKLLVEKEAEKIGLGVGREELRDLQFGANPSPLLAQRQFTPDMMQQIQQMVDKNEFPQDGRLKAYLIEQEREIIKERLQSKIQNMVAKGIYAPTWQAEMAFRENNEKIDFLYTRVPFDRMQDTEVQVTDADYAAYLKENAKQYYNYEETRVIDYVAVDVVPTAADSAVSREGLAKIVEDFRTATNDSAYIAKTSGGTMGAGFTKKAGLPTAVADALSAAAVGTVVGPYLDGSSFAIAKVLDRKSIPDSVRARHILTKTPGTAGKAFIDSLKTVIETGKGTFADLAKVHGTDGTAPKGGDLGFFAQGQMVQQFNDLCFGDAEQGKLYSVETQFGWHLVEVTGKKFLNNEAAVKLATIKQRIEPSKATQDRAKDKANALTQSAKTSADLEAKAKELGLTLQTSTPIKNSDYFLGALGQGNDAVEIIRAAFKTDKVGAVDKNIYVFNDAEGGFFDSKYAVFALKSINPKGEATVAAVKTQIEKAVKDRAKAKAIIAKIGGSTDLGTIASQFGVTVDSAKGASFMSSSLPNVGAEPKVIGTAFRLKNGESSAPIDGNTGVFVVKAIQDKPQGQLPPDLTLFRRQAASTASSNVRGRLFQIIKKSADIQDMRY